jgi:uncharacterized protein YydD (DUF2326 family)
MIMILAREKEMGPDFLIHDSHLFDGVDERQIAKALEIASKLTGEYKFQYIVTMNSDDLPEESQEFKISEYILPVKLTDATEDGGLFGLRIKPPVKTEEDSEAEEE